MKQMIDLLLGYKEVDAPETAMDLNLEKLKEKKKTKYTWSFYRCSF